MSVAAVGKRVAARVVGSSRPMYRRISIPWTVLFKISEGVALFGLLAMQNSYLEVETLAKLGVVFSTYSLIGTFLYGPIGIYISVNFSRLFHRNSWVATIGLNFVFSVLCGLSSAVALTAVASYVGFSFSLSESAAVLIFVVTKFLFMGQTNTGVLLFTHRQTGAISLAASLAGVVIAYGVAGTSTMTLMPWLIALTASYIFGYVLLVFSQIKTSLLPRVAPPSYAPPAAPLYGWHVLALIAVPAFRWAQIEFPRIAAARTLSTGTAGAYFATSQLLLVAFMFSEIVLAMYYGPILSYLYGKSRITALRAFSLDVAFAYGSLATAASLIVVAIWPVIASVLEYIAPHLATLSPFVIFAILMGEVARQTSAFILSSFVHIRRYQSAVLIGFLPVVVAFGLTSLTQSDPRPEIVAGAVMVGNIGTAAVVLLTARPGRIVGTIVPLSTLWLVPLTGAVIAGAIALVGQTPILLGLGALSLVSLLVVGAVSGRRAVGVGMLVTRRAAIAPVSTGT